MSEVPLIAEELETCKHCHRQIWYSHYVAIKYTWYHTHNNNAFCDKMTAPNGIHAEPAYVEDLPLEDIT